MGLITAGISLGASWLKAGSAGDWDESYMGGRATGAGGVLERLEQDTGKEYPYLQNFWQDAEDKWVKYQRAWPWSKGSTLKTYQNAVVVFLEAYEAELALSRGVSLGGIEVLAKYKYYLIGTIVVIFVLLLVVKKR